MAFKKYILFILLVITQDMLWAANFNQGLAAFNREDYTQAYKIWQEIAEAKTAEVTKEFRWKKTSTTQKKEAQYGLGLLYWQGKGLEQDYKQAQYWLKRAATQGHKEAALKLGFLYLNALAGQKDEYKAREWFLKAANAGQVDAQHNLGLLFLQGVGGAKDLVQAKYWFTQASEQGDVAAQKHLVELAEKPKFSTKQVVTVVKEGVKTLADSPKISFEPEVEQENLYAIQIATLSNEGNVYKTVDKYPSTKWAFYKKNISGREVYVLLRCCFVSKQEAKLAVRELPIALQKIKPWIVRKGNFDLLFP